MSHLIAFRLAVFPECLLVRLFSSQVHNDLLLHVLIPDLYSRVVGARIHSKPHKRTNVWVLSLWDIVKMCWLLEDVRDSASNSIGLTWIDPVWGRNDSKGDDLDQFGRGTRQGRVTFFAFHIVSLRVWICLSSYVCTALWCNVTYIIM